MIGSVATSRRANAFAQALDEHTLDGAPAAEQAAGDAPPGPDGPGGDPGEQATPPTRADRGTAESGPEPSPLLALADGLAALPRPELDPEVKTVQRAQLIAAMESAFAEGTAAGEAGRIPGQRDAHDGHGAHRAPGLSALDRLRPKSRLAKGLTAGGLGVGVAASAFGGVATASGNALPGESLYGVKRGVEDLKLDLAGGDTDRGQVYLDHASTRLHEARRLMERGRTGHLDHESLGEVRRALSGMRSDATEGHRLLSTAYERDGDIAPMRSLSSFSKSHRTSWSQLKDRLPVQLTDVGDEVSSVFDAMDSDVQPVEGLIGGAPARQDTGETDTRPGPGERTDDGASEQQPSPSGPSGQDTPSAEKSGEPSPSGSAEEKDGLLGGGGLLDPPKGPDESPSGTDDRPPGLPKAPEADVTLPPIVPEVLPGLNDLSGGGKKN